MRLAGFVLLWMAVALSRATSVLPPSFEELVRGSRLVFRGRVIDVHVGISGEPGQRHTATFVSFAIENMLKGSVHGPLTLEFMGGEIAGRGLYIAGLPRFVPGERGVFFVENPAGRFCPIMRLRHGRYRIATDPVSGTEHVARDDGAPLQTVAQVTAALGEKEHVSSNAVSANGMELGAFERAIASQVVSSGTAPAAQ